MFYNLCNITISIYVFPFLFFSVIVTAIEGKDVEFKQIKELESKDLSEETLSVIYSGLMKLLQSALRLPLESLKQEVCMSVSL